MTVQTVIRGQERRIFDRFTTFFPAKVKDSREKFGESINVMDFSAWGVRILSKDRYFLNDHVAIEVDVMDGHPPVDLRGEIVWVKRHHDNRWELGLKLAKIDFMKMYRFMERVEDISSPSKNVYHLT